MNITIEKLIRQSIKNESDIDHETIPSLVFRALRKTELPLFYERGYIFPPCDECIEEDESQSETYYEKECLQKKSKIDCHKCYTKLQNQYLKSINKECCIKSIPDHISKGSTAKVKSKYISLTKKLSVACTYNSKNWNAKNNTPNNVTLNTNNNISKKKHSGIIAVIATDGLNIINPLKCYDTTKQEPTYIQFAKASYELIVPNKISFSNIITFIKSIKVTQTKFDEMIEGRDCIAKLVIPKSKRKKESAKQYFILTHLNLKEDHIGKIKKSAGIGLKSRFARPSTRIYYELDTNNNHRNQNRRTRNHSHNRVSRKRRHSHNRNSNINSTIKSGAIPKAKTAKRTTVSSRNNRSTKTKLFPTKKEYILSKSITK